ncbi:MAG: T9SS type A sorting domain-containing protein [Janthinobacterium lividum]
MPGVAQVAGADARQSSLDSWAALTDMGTALDFPFQLLSNTPLPVTLAAFSAQALRRSAVQLQWTTASELQSARFVVERSRDGQDFAAIGSVEAAGTTTTLRAYALLDTQLPPSETTLYYRLRQIDQDGISAYSPVRPVALVPAALATFPNPANRATTLTGALAGAPVNVVDALGRTVTTTTADATGTAQLPLPAGLASGVYVVHAGGQALRLLVK